MTTQGSDMFKYSISGLLCATAFLTFFSFTLFTGSAFAVPAAPFPHTTVQPDGAEITLHSRGDEHFNWMEDD